MSEYVYISSGAFYGTSGRPPVTSEERTAARREFVVNSARLARSGHRESMPAVVAAIQEGFTTLEQLGVSATEMAKFEAIVSRMGPTAATIKAAAENAKEWATT